MQTNDLPPQNLKALACPNCGNSVRVLDDGSAICDACGRSWSTTEGLPIQTDLERVNEQASVQTALPRMRQTEQEVPAIFADPAEEGVKAETVSSAISVLVLNHVENQAVAKRHGIHRPLTEQGNAERFLDAFSDEVRFDHTSHRWLLWEGPRWALDEAGRVPFLVKKTLRGIYGEAGLQESAEERENTAKWAVKSEKANAVDAVLKLAPSEPTLAVTAADLNKDSWSLNLLNGTLDLKAGQLRPHRREDLITYVAAVAYDPQAKAPRWDRFIEEVFPDAEVRAYVQTLAGYCLTGDTSAQDFNVAWGGGGNGKTVFFQTLRDMLADYAGEISPDVLMASRYQDGGKAATPQLAGTAGKRLIAASESAAGAKLDDALVKLYTGGERIVARFLHGNPFSFKPTAKLILFTNHRPRIPATDVGIWRRVRLIPFTVTIPDDRKDEHLRDKLREEWPGILNWCLQGLERWQERGLCAPQAIVDATGQYRASEDALGAFLATCVQEPSARARSGKLYERYCAWCESEHENVMGSRSFKAAMEERGFKSGHDDKGSYFDGIHASEPAFPDGRADG